MGEWDPFLQTASANPCWVSQEEPVTLRLKCGASWAELVDILQRRERGAPLPARAPDISWATIALPHADQKP
eukprot:COSAG01_NODE_15717_length_1306_cov_21.748136_4_plen_72_part_00